jgi:c-di-GMP-binding flagellar brake protein YcgR
MSNANSSGMSTTDRRRYKRIETSNLISYVFIDKEGNEIKEGMGRTLNISQGGLLLEAYLPVKVQFILIMYIDLEGQLLKTKGKVVHSRPGESGNFFVGVRFVDTHES